MSLAGLGAGLAAGGGLGLYGFRTTVFQPESGNLFYTPTTHMGLALSLLFALRIAYRLMEIYVLEPAAGAAGIGFVHSPLTLLLFGLVAGYCISYAVGLARWRARVLPQASAPGKQRKRGPAPRACAQQKHASRPRAAAPAFTRRGGSGYIPASSASDRPASHRGKAMNIDVRSRIVRRLCLLAAPLAFAGAATAGPVSLDNETATFCQDGYPIYDAFDGGFGSGSGWAIDPTEGNNQVAVVKAGNDIGGSGETRLTFRLHMFWGGQHTIGKFRLSATTSGRSTYGQGATCSDATPGGGASWTVLFPQVVASQNGQTLTVQPDGSVLASGNNPDGDLVTFQVTTTLRGITGFRLEVLTDPSFVNNGPGRAGNGNFVLNELTLDASPIVPVPALESWAMALMALLLAGIAMRRLRP